MRTKIIVLLLVAAFSLVACGITENSHETNSDLTDDISTEQPSENSQNDSVQNIQSETFTDALKTESGSESTSDEQRIYREHIKKANIKIRKICAEMADKNWEKITCFHYVPEDFCEYEGFKIDFQDFRDLYIESSENPEDYYYTIIGSIPGRGGKISQTPLLVVAIISFDQETSDGVIRSVLYNTESGFAYTESWQHPDGNVICDAYDADLWSAMYSY